MGLVVGYGWSTFHIVLNTFVHNAEETPFLKI